MKKLITLALIALSLSCFGQSKHKNVRMSDDRSGIVIASTGLMFSIIAVTVPDGGDWTFKTTYGSQKTYKPFFQQPARVSMLGVGLTLTIGGAAYHRNRR